MTASTCSPSPTAAACYLQNGERLGCRSSNSGWIVVERCQSCRRGDRECCDGRDPTSNRRSVWTPDGDAEEEMAAAARAALLRALSSSAPPSLLQVSFRALSVEVPAPVECRASDQSGHGTMSSSQARPRPLAEKVRTIDA